LRAQVAWAHVGLPKKDLHDLLGDSPSCGPPVSWSLAKIWRYGDVEFHFHDKAQNINLIFFDHDHLLMVARHSYWIPGLLRKGLCARTLRVNLLRQVSFFQSSVRITIQTSASLSLAPTSISYL
jgi:hypothetical protein